MVKSLRGEKAVLRKGPWTREEDEKLMAYIQQHGHGSWCSLPAKAGLKRCGKSCRLRWINYLRPDIKRGKFSSQDDQAIIQLHALLGNRWSAIALHLPKRTDNEIKNHWHSHLKKRLTRLGIDPTTHKPINPAFHGGHAANLNHMAQWETARLQAEARLARQSKLRLQIKQQLGSFSSQPSPTRLILNKITPPPSLPPCLDVLKAWQNSWPSSTSKSSTPTTNTADNTPKMNNMYAMMLTTDDDLKPPTSTLCFPGTSFLNSNSTDNSTMTTSGLENSVGSFLGDDDLMAAVEAFRSEGYNCNNPMEGLYKIEDVLVYGFNNENSPQQQNLGILNSEEEAGSSNFEEKHYWETILNLVNDFPSDDLQFPCLI